MLKKHETADLPSAAVSTHFPSKACESYHTKFDQILSIIVAFNHKFKKVSWKCQNALPPGSNIPGTNTVSPGP